MWSACGSRWRSDSIAGGGPRIRQKPAPDLREAHLKPNAVAWRPLFAEAAAIILSILAAFSIDAWWDMRRDVQEEREVLAGLRAEFVEVAGRLDGWATFNTVQGELVRRARTDEMRELPDPAADSLLSSLPYVHVIDRGGGTRDALLSFGRLALIRDGGLREPLARWPDRMEDIHTNDLSIRDYVWRSVLPYMAADGVPDGRCTGIPYCLHAEELPDPCRRVLSDATFRSLLPHFEAFFNGIAADHREARDTAGDLIHRIDVLLVS